MAEETPTTERLALALEEARAPKRMIDLARAGHYDDFKSELAFPIRQLVADLRASGMPNKQQFINRVTDGEFDATKAESDEWARSPEGQEILSSYPRNPFVDDRG